MKRQRSVEEKFMLPGIGCILLYLIVGLIVTGLLWYLVIRILWGLAH